MNDKQLQELFDKQAITEKTYQYCRGLDRMDKELAYSIWHEHGTANYYGLFEGTGRNFIDWVWIAHESMERHSHQVTNILIEIDGKKAVSENYFSVDLWTKPELTGETQQILVKGRQLDQWANIDGCWGLTHRDVIIDMQTTDAIREPFSSPESKRTPDDPSFKLFPMQ
jgi:hypothetical protein